LYAGGIKIHFVPLFIRVFIMTMFINVVTENSENVQLFS